MEYRLVGSQIKPGSSVHSSPLRNSIPCPNFQDLLQNFQVQVQLAHFLAQVQFQVQEVTLDLAQVLKPE